MKVKDYDFGGWVTKNDIRCSDGVTIKHNAFQDDNGKRVPLVYNHDHSSPENVLGHIILENHPEGVYGYGFFNKTESGMAAKEMVEHGDITAMSIFAKKLKSVGSNLIHGAIKEVSLVLAGANPGALIDEVNIAHSDNGDYTDGEAIIYTPYVIHAASQDAPTTEEDEEVGDKASNEKTVEEVLGGMSEEQLAAVGTLVQSVIEEYEEGNDSEEGDDGEVKHNVFSKGKDKEDNENYLSHDELHGMIGAARSNGGKLSDQFVAHGIDGVDIMFPEAQLVGDRPQIFNQINTASDIILAKVGKTPFARVKNLIVDISEEEVRALGYVTGDRKIDGTMRLLRRETHPQTIYVKQAFENDDIIDVDEFDLLQFGQQVMRLKYNEEIARAILKGDGRSESDRNKIKEDRIRPVISDDDLYTIKMVVPSVAVVLEQIILAMGEYRGSGSPDLFINPTLLAEMKFVKGTDNRYLFGDIPTSQAIAARLGVNSIIETSLFKDKEFLIINFNDYKLGAVRGGQLTSYSDFDIDFNLHKFLMEGRLSGALVMPYSAIYGKVDTSKNETTRTPSATLPNGYVAAFDKTKHGNSSSVIRRTDLKGEFGRNDPRYGGTPDGTENPRWTGDEAKPAAGPTVPTPGK